MKSIARMTFLTLTDDLWNKIQFSKVIYVINDVEITFIKI